MTTSNEEWNEIARKYAKDHGLETTLEGRELIREHNYFAGFRLADYAELRCNYNIGRWLCGGYLEGGIRRCIHDSADTLTAILSQGDFDKVEGDLKSRAELFEYKTTFENPDKGVRRQSHFNYVPGTVHLRLLDGFQQIPVGGEGRYKRLNIPTIDPLRIAKVGRQYYFQPVYKGDYNLAFLFTDEQDHPFTRNIPHCEGKRMLWKVATSTWGLKPLVDDETPSENAIAFAMKNIRKYLKEQRMPFCVANAGIYWHPDWRAENGWFNS